MSERKPITTQEKIQHLKPEIFWRIEPHCHFEGGQILELILKIASEKGLNFDDETIELFRNIQNSDSQEKSPKEFFKKLNTRILQLLIAKIMVKFSDNNPHEEIFTCLRDLYTHTLISRIYNDRLRSITLFFSPFNLAVDGDILEKVIKAIFDPDPNWCEEEKAVYTQLAKKTCEKLKNENGEISIESLKSQLEKSGITWKSYVRIAGSIKKSVQQTLAKKYGNYSSKIILSICLRREKAPDRSMMERLDPEDIGFITKSFISGETDGVDLAGAENPETPILNYLPFFSKLNESNIPNSIHIGETPYNSINRPNGQTSPRQVAYRNLNSLAEWINENPDRLKTLTVLAHAARIEDSDNPNAKNKKLSKIRKTLQDVGIAFNARSNYETGVSGKRGDERHPILEKRLKWAIENLDQIEKKYHSFFAHLESEAEHKRMQRLAIIHYVLNDLYVATDDPVVYLGEGNSPLKNELIFVYNQLNSLFIKHNLGKMSQRQFIVTLTNIAASYSSKVIMKIENLRDDSVRIMSESNRETEETPTVDHTSTEAVQRAQV